MFCPVCKYEYRRGFTRCNDCDVDLVDTLPAESASSGSSASAAQMVEPTLLWRGSNAGTTFSEITMALDSAQIPYNREELDARLLFSSEYMQLDIWVPAAHLDDAKKLLDEIIDSNERAAEQARFELPEEDVAEDSEMYSAPADVLPEDAVTLAEDLDPEDATCEVWSGEDSTMSHVLKSCLAEIGVASHIEETGSGNFSLRVNPQNELRAQRLVRQVLDASAPE